MSVFTRIASTTFAVATAATLVAGATAPAYAADVKPVTIKMPASALTDPAAKLCMPREMIDKSKHSDLPRTVCQTRDEWAAAGVTIIARK